MSKGSRQRPSQVPQAQVDANWDTIFGKNKIQENVDEVSSCGCGRSPTGKCIGWHGLSEGAYEQALMQYNDNQKSKSLPL